MKTKTPAIVILIAVVFAVFANTLYNGFIYDDTAQVLQNRWLKDIRFIPEILSSSAWSFFDKDMVFHYYRPVMHLLYMGEYHIFGYAPWGWHLTNVLLHIFNAVMVFLIAGTLLPGRRGGVGSGDGNGEASSDGAIAGEPVGGNQTKCIVSSFPVLPFIAALFYAVNPVTTEVVAWVAGVPELTFTALFLPALYLYILSSDAAGDDPSWQCQLKRPAYIASVLFFFFALFCKETAMTLPIILLAFDFYRRRSFISVGFITRYLPYAAVAVVYLFIRFKALGGMGALSVAHDYMSAYDFLINVPPLIAAYYYKLILPVNLSAFYIFYPVKAIGEARSLLSIFFVIFLILLFIYFAARKRRAFFFLSITFIPLLPVLYIPGLSLNVFADRYLYVPSIGLGLLVSLLVGRLLMPQLQGGGAACSKKAVTYGVVIALSLIFIFYSAGSVKRNAEWRDVASLWGSTASKYPDNYFSHDQLARYFRKDNQLKRAIHEYGASIRLNEALEHPHRDFLAETYYNLGEALGEAQDFAQAEAAYVEAIKMQARPHTTRDSLINLAIIYANRGEKTRAIRALEEALRLDPNDTFARHNLQAIKSW